MTSDIAFAGAVELGKKIARGAVTSTDVTRMMLERIERLNGALKCYETVMADQALADAKKADREIKAKKSRGPLHGVPIGIKDLCDIEGIPTASGIPMFRSNIAKRTSTVAARLKAAGAVILGKLQLTEGALALHHPEILPPVNPWRRDRWSGASSSGSGVATAAGLCYGSLGSDTGGSIRFPSIANGCVGLKPTWGRVSRYGVFPARRNPRPHRADDAAGRGLRRHARRHRRPRRERSIEFVRAGAELPGRCRQGPEGRHPRLRREVLQCRRRPGDREGVEEGGVRAQESGRHAKGREDARDGSRCDGLGADLRRRGGHRP
jgi:hypothetical protein